MPKHPVDAAIARMSPRDQRIADHLAEAGFSDEDLYAALPNPGAERLLRNEPKPKKRTRGVSASDGKTQAGAKEDQRG
jgi:hypothetical protein